MSLFLTNFSKLIAQNLTIDTKFDYSVAIESAKSTLIQQGLTPEKAEELEKLIGDPREKFPIGGVLNPDYLEYTHGQKGCFIICDAREGRYEIVRRVAETYSREASRHIVYGPEDSILIIYGLDADFAKAFNDLQKNNLRAIDLMIDTTILFKRHRVAKWKPLEHQIPFKDIDRIVEDYHSPGLEDVRHALEETKILLGGALVEDFATTERIHAFIGLNLFGQVPSTVHRGLLDSLLDDPDIARALVSVFRCKTAAFHYILELICDLPSELDLVTDKFNEIFANQKSDIRAETSTYVVAKSFVQLPKHVSANGKDPLGSTDKPEAVSMTQIKTRYLDTIPVETKKKYANKPIFERLNLIFLLLELDHLLPRDDDSVRASLSDSFSLLVEGVIEENRTRLIASFQPLIAEFEKVSKSAVKKLTDLFFKGNKGILQGMAGLDSYKKINAWTLGDLGKAFEKMNEIDLYQRIGIEFQKEFLEKYEAFVNLRNTIIHAKPDARIDNLADLTREITDAFRDGMFIIAYLSESVLQKDLSMVPVELLMSRSEIDDDEILGILNEINLTVEIINNRIGDLDPQIRDGFELLVVKINAMRFDNLHAEKRFQEALDLIIENSEHLIATLDGEEKSRVTKLLSKARNLGKDVGANTIANLITDILITTAPAYSEELIRLLKDIFT